MTAVPRSGGYHTVDFSRIESGSCGTDLRRKRPLGRLMFAFAGACFTTMFAGVPTVAYSGIGHF
jgi:hypothetical protein